MVAPLKISKISVLLVLLLVAAGPAGFGGEVLYEDAFANLDSSWSTDGDIISVKKGTVTLRPPPNTSQSVLSKSHVFEDAEIQVDVMVSSDDTGALGGLVFWAKDYTDFYCFCIKTSGYFNIGRYVAGQWVKPVDWTESKEINKRIGQINKLRVITANGQATAYINDRQVVTFDAQPSRARGYIGIFSRASAANSPAAWQFSNLRAIVTSPQVAASPPPPISSASPQPREPCGPATSWLEYHRGGARADAVPRFPKTEGATSVRRRPSTREDETELEAVLPAESSYPLVFEIHAHGSNTAFEDLATSACDVGMSSRRVTKDEAQRCARAGLPDADRLMLEIYLAAKEERDSGTLMRLAEALYPDRLIAPREAARVRKAADPQAEALEDVLKRLRSDLHEELSNAPADKT